MAFTSNFLTDFFKNTFTKDKPLKIYTPNDTFDAHNYSPDRWIFIEYFFIIPAFEKLGLDYDYFANDTGDAAEAYFTETVTPSFSPQVSKCVIYDHHETPTPESNFWAQIQKIKISDVLKKFTTANPLRISYLANSVSASDPRATTELRNKIGLDSVPRLIHAFCRWITFTGTLIKGQKNTINATFKGVTSTVTTPIVVSMPQPAVPIQPASDISAATMADILKKFTTANPLKLRALR